MFEWRKWAGCLCFLSVFLSSSLATAAADASKPKDRLAAGVPSNRDVRISESQVPLSEELTGTLSGLVRDPAGFYWTHTDGGSATPDWQVRLVKLKMTGQGAKVMEVIPMTDEQGQVLTGDVFDPEDVAVAPDGTLWLVDEITPVIVQVSREGRILRRVEAPERYKSRVKGRGFEGAAMSADGSTLYLILQTGLSTETDKTHTWLLAFDVASGTFKEYPYHLDRTSDYAYENPSGVWIGANGLSVLGPDELLVLERDNLAGVQARVKRIYRVKLPAEPSDQPLAKQLYLDLRALGYYQEKVEGMAIANPNSIMVINDNDGDLSKPTFVWHLQL